MSTIRRAHDFRSKNWQQLIDDYLATGPSFSKWEVWTALVTHIQLRDAFGWEFYGELFAQYRAIPSSERPNNNDKRVQEWVRRSSVVAGVNLWPFYAAWGFPTPSAEVLAEVQALPPWADNPMQGLRLRQVRQLEELTQNKSVAGAYVDNTVLAEPDYFTFHTGSVVSTGLAIESDGELIAYDRGSQGGSWEG